MVCAFDMHWAVLEMSISGVSIIHLRELKIFLRVSERVRKNKNALKASPSDFETLDKVFKVIWRGHFSYPPSKMA